MFYGDNMTYLIGKDISVLDNRINNMKKSVIQNREIIEKNLRILVDEINEIKTRLDILEGYNDKKKENNETKDSKK